MINLPGETEWFCRGGFCFRRNHNMNQEKNLNVKQVPYIDARERVMGYTQFLKRYWAWENGITLYKDPENHSGPWERYEEISDGSFEENIIKQCGTRGEKLIKCISDLSDRLKVIIDTVVGDVEISEGGYSRAREFLKKNRNRPLKLTECNIDFFILLLSETKDVNAVIKRAQEGKLEKEDRHVEGQIEKGLRSLAENQEMNFSGEFIEKRINELFLEESKVPRIYRDVMSKVGDLTETVEGYASPAIRARFTPDNVMYRFLKSG